MIPNKLYTTDVWIGVNPLMHHIVAIHEDKADAIQYGNVLSFYCRAFIDTVRDNDYKHACALFESLQLISSKAFWDYFKKALNLMTESNSKEAIVYLVENIVDLGVSEVSHSKRTGVFERTTNPKIYSDTWPFDINPSMVSETKFLED